MLFFSIPFILAFVGLVLAQDRSLSAVKRAFHDANIPETINLPFNPRLLLEVTFPQPSCDSIILHAGVQLTMNETASPPTFSLKGNIRRPGPFVIVLVDPDALTPQNPAISQVRHFLGGNFFFANSHSRKHWAAAPLTNSTPAVTEFVKPRPPVWSDAHRYIFLLFNQPEAFNEQTLFNPASSRIYFNVSSFAAAVGLGEPIAGTYMLVGPDPPTA